MIYRIAFLLGLLFVSPSFAADNATLITPCASGCVTMRSKDIGGGVQSMVQILGDTSGNAIYGTAGAPNANVLSVQGIASGTALPVSQASGSVASGAYASGSLAAGAGVDGWDVTQGAKADSACGTDNGTCSVAALIKRANQNLTTLNTTASTGTGNTGSAVPAAAVYMGLNVGGNLTGATSAGFGVGATGSAPPANANYLGANVAGNLTGSIKCGSSVVYDASTNGSTQLVALSGSTKIYVCGYTILAAGTVNVELDYGTGTACATGNNKMTPAYQLTAQVGAVDGASEYRGLSTPAAQELCLKTSAGTAVQAVVYYTQF